jgi:hypothetical protein
MKPLLINISAWLRGLSSGYTILASLTLYIIFIGVVMAPESELVAKYAGDWGSPDGHLFYTPNELYAQIELWGSAGRAHYVDFRLGLDPVWALVYTAFLITVTSVALRNTFAPDDSRQLLNLFPLLPMLGDLTENGLGMVLISSFPTRYDGLAWLAATVSGFKWSTLVVAHLIMLYAIGAAAAARLRR